MKPRQPVTIEAVTAAVLADDLVPETVFYSLHGGATTFRTFEEEGLPVYIQNRRRCVRPSEMKAFITNRAKLTNPAEVKALVADSPELATALAAPKRIADAAAKGGKR